MATIRELNQKIRSLGNMQKVMRAMNMIATVKLRKLYTHHETLKLFDKALAEINQATALASLSLEHALLGNQRTVKRTHVIIFTADKGLCGSHNHSVFRALDSLCQSHQTGILGMELSCVGNKAIEYAKRFGYEIIYSTPSAERSLDYNAIHRLGKDLVNRVLNNEVQEIYLIYNHFVSTLHQDTITKCLLPLSPSQKSPTKGPIPSPPVVEPQGKDFLESAAHLLLEYSLRSALVHSQLSEHASRMTAMENAAGNSRDLMDRYSQLRNRARQSTITGELIEIISGTEALKG